MVNNVDMLTFAQYLCEHPYIHDSQARQWGYFNGRRVVDGNKVDFKTFGQSGGNGTHGALSYETKLGSGMEGAMIKGWIRFAILRDGSSLYTIMVPSQKELPSRLKTLAKFLETNRHLDGEVSLDIYEDKDGNVGSKTVSTVWHHGLASTRWPDLKTAQNALRAAISTGQLGKSFNNPTQDYPEAKFDTEYFSKSEYA
jgi:hypothetical protein